MKKIIITLIKFYQLTISPLLGQNCRFVPSCSNYAIAAIKKYGCLVGGWISLKRIIRCNPWNSNCGEDLP